MVKITTAARLLSELAKESIAARDAVATAAGVPIERAAAAMCGDTHLTLSEQFRLAEAATLCAPAHRRIAQQLKHQVLAARSNRNVMSPAEIPSPVERWERSLQLRR
jgi:hypothetical protein